jgi:2-methylisocitrate lyase-like PEP mutase family enzyme
VNVFKGGKTPMLPVERLEKMGYRIAIYPSETQRAAIFAMRNALSTLKRDGTTESIDTALTTFKDRDKVVDLDGWQKLEKEFMTVEKNSPKDR